MLVPYTRNGGMVGATLDFADQSYYQRIGTIPLGQELITNAGTTSWVVPEGVTSISVVCVGAGGGGGGGEDNDETGGGGGGGALAYVNNISVTPGETLTSIVGAGGNGGGGGGNGGVGGPTSLQRSGTNLASAGGGSGGQHRGNGGAGGTVIVGTGGSGGQGGNGSDRDTNNAGGGGGAGGYSGNGGLGADENSNNATAGSGGGGGGGGRGTSTTTRGGGGVGLLGEGANGAAGALNVSGGGGSGGNTGAYSGGLYGGGGAGGDGGASGAAGANGAIRIIWGGDRTFPATNTADGQGTSTGLTNGNKKNSGIWDLAAVYDSIVSQPQYALGLTPSLLTISGQLNAWTQQTVDISAYASATVRLVFRYVNTGGSFTSDIQLDLINLDGNTYSFENQTHSFETSDATNYNGIDYTSVNFQNVGVSSNLNGFWQVDSGGTPSGSTGRTDAQDGTFYIYFESSGAGATANFTSWLRSPQITLGTTPTLTFYEARLGASIGQLDVYLEVIS